MDERNLGIIKKYLTVQKYFNNLGVSEITTEMKMNAKTTLANEAIKQMAKMNNVSVSFVIEQIESRNEKAIKQFEKLFTLALEYCHSKYWTKKQYEEAL